MYSYKVSHRKKNMRLIAYKIYCFSRLETSVMSDDVPAPVADIVSSQKEVEPSITDYSTYQQRAAFTTTVSATSYTTTFAFVATSITSTTSLGIASGLLCLPSGYVICT
jgi:hypothetical protein